MTIKEFTTSAKAAADDDTGALGKPIQVTVDEREVTFYPPTEGQLAVFFAGASDSSSQVNAVASTINFFFSLLDDDDIRYFKVRLFNRKDPFDAENIVEIVEYVIGEWSARPTKQPSDFMPSQSNTGRTSTARRHKQV